MSSPSDLSNPDDSAYQHTSASRPNQPTSETAPLMDDHQRAPEAFHAGRRFPAGFANVYADAVKQQAPHLNKDLSGHPLLAWDRSGTTSLLTGDASIDEVHGFAGSPLFTREKVTPALLLEQLRRPGGGAELQLDFDGLDEGADEYDWYRHSGRWQNRLIHGDSAAVMQSLIAKDRMAGQVQMIYFDPPYGMGFKSNFQTATKKLETPEKLDGVPVGDTLPLRAFRDSYRNGIHSYLDGIHERAVLARELLTDTGSLFVQIGDENVHRLALVLDEVFGPENRVATITWRPTGGSSARTLPESASYLLWYAKDKSRCKYRQIYDDLSVEAIIEQWNRSFSPAMVEVDSKESVRLKPDKTGSYAGQVSDPHQVFQGTPLNSMGSSTRGRTRWVTFREREYHCGTGRQWRVSIHDGDAPVCAPPDDNGARTEASPPCPDPQPCGMCWLGWQGRIDDSGTSLRWKYYASEFPGHRIDNVWSSRRSPSNKRYVVQTSNAIIERCLLMTTDPGDLVLDPTCGSGVTADVAEEWGRRWVTIDVSRVASAVARQHLATSAYTWHRITDGGNDPANDFVCKSMRKVSAGRLADPDTDWAHPDNIIKLVDQTDVDRKRLRLCSPFTVESHSPYSHLPFSTPPGELDNETATAGVGTRSVGSTGSGQDNALFGLAGADTEDAILDALGRSPVCDAEGRELLQVIDRERWPGTQLVAFGVTCTRPGRDAELTAGLMIAAPDASVTAEQVRQATAEARRNAADCTHLIVVGFAFDPDVPATVGACEAHRVVASQDLQIPELAPDADGGSFTLLGEPDCEVRRTTDGTSLTVKLLGCDTYDPATGMVREANHDQIDCWMVDTDHDQLSFVARLTYFPNGVNRDAGLKAAAKSLRRKWAGDAEADIVTDQSTPFPIPADGRTVAVKIITDTGAEMNTVVGPDAWTPA